jgi:hypothetical protein
MGQRYVVVLVFRHEEVSLIETEQTLQLVAAELTALGGERDFVAEQGSELFAVRWRVSANAIHRDGERGLFYVERLLATAVGTLPPRFAWFSIFDEHGTDDWVWAQIDRVRAGGGMYCSPRCTR